MLRAICGVQLKDVKRVKHLMSIFDLNKTMDKLAIASRVCFIWPCLEEG